MKRSLRTKVLFLLVAMLLTLNGCALRIIPNNLFSEGLLAVEKNDRYGYIDTKGNKVIDYYFDEAYAFNGKYAIVVRNGKYNFIDKNGNTQLEDDLEYLYFDDETGHLWFVKDDKLGLMKTNGDIIIEAKYELSVEEVSPWALEAFTFFQEGLARVAKNGKLGYINVKGEVVIDFTYDDCGHFYQGLAYYMSATEKYGYIDKKGKIIINAEWDYAEEFNQNKQAIVANIDNEYNYTYALIDNKGETVIGGLDDIEDHNELYIIIKDDVCSIINTKGKTVNDGTYHDFYEIGDFILMAVLNDEEIATKISVFDIDGKLYYDLTEAETEGDELSDFITDNDKIYLVLIPETGNMLTLKLKSKTWTFEADDVISVKDDLVITNRNGERGVRNFKDEMIVDYLYSYIGIYDDGYILVREDGKYGILNLKGKTIVEPTFDSCNTSVNTYNK